MKKQYRNGAIGALMDEYEHAGNELKNLVKGISETDFEKGIDPNTKDEDCRSVQTIISHVINSGYGYANYIRDWYSIPIKSIARRLFSRAEYIKEMNKMLDYTCETLEGKWKISEEEIMKIKIKSRWGPEYDIEQLLEHAIVHIMRHRRQIEKIISTGKITFK